MFKVTNLSQGPLVITDIGLTLQPGEDTIVPALTNGLRQARSLGLLSAEKVDKQPEEPPISIPALPEDPPPLPERPIKQEVPEPLRAESPPLPTPECSPLDTASMRVSDAVAYLERETDVQKILHACRRDRRSTVRRAATIRIGELNAAQ